MIYIHAGERKNFSSQMRTTRKSNRRNGKQWHKSLAINDFVQVKSHLFIDTINYISQCVVCVDLCMVVIFAPFLETVVVVFVFKKLIHRRIDHNFEQKLLFVLTHTHTATHKETTPYGYIWNVDIEIDTDTDIDRASTIGRLTHKDGPALICINLR